MVVDEAMEYLALEKLWRERVSATDSMEQQQVAK
jgi:hypothetical protein